MKRVAGSGWSEDALARFATARANRLSEFEVDHLVVGLRQHGFAIEDEYRSGANGGDWLVEASRSGVRVVVWYEGRDAALAYRVGRGGEAYFLDTVREKVGPEKLVHFLLAALEGAA